MWPNPQFSADLVTFTKEILDGKLHFLCIDCIAQNVIRLRHHSHRQLIGYGVRTKFLFSYLCWWFQRVTHRKRIMYNFVYLSPTQILFSRNVPQRKIGRLPIIYLAYNFFNLFPSTYFCYERKVKKNSELRWKKLLKTFGNFLKLF